MWIFSNFDLLNVINSCSCVFTGGDIGIVVTVLASGPGDLVSIQGRDIPKIWKMVLDTSLLNTQHYKVRVKVKVKQYRERSSALSDTLV